MRDKTSHFEEYRINQHYDEIPRAWKWAVVLAGMLALLLVVVLAGLLVQAVSWLWLLP